MSTLHLLATGILRHKTLVRDDELDLIPCRRAFLDKRNAISSKIRKVLVCDRTVFAWSLLYSGTHLCSIARRRGMYNTK